MPFHCLLGNISRITCSLHFLLVFLPYVFANFEGSLRLVGGSKPSEGRVEFNKFGQWGTICDDQWDIRDGEVVCQQLGYLTALNVFGGAHFGEGTGPIFLDDVSCFGNEERLEYCTLRYQTNCDHSEDAGVECQPINGEEQPWTDGSVRLISFNTSHEGRVEILFHDNWVTISEEWWGIEEANVVYRQLGYPGAMEAFGGDFDELRYGGLVMTLLNCTGEELNLVDCANFEIEVEFTYNHDYDASVSCNNKDMQTNIDESKKTIRLVGGASPLEGRVEILDGRWVTICPEEWTEDSAWFVCRHLGYTNVNAYLSYYGDGPYPKYRYLSCHGDEEEWQDCLYRLQNTQFCRRQVGVRCSDFANEGTLRLTGSTVADEGRLEIFHEGQWGTVAVCNNPLDDTTADIACKQLGFDRSIPRNDSENVKPKNDQSIFLSDVVCEGTESLLTECAHSGWNVQTCDHKMDVWLQCQTPSLYTPRLYNGTVPNEGRLEVWYDGDWKRLCPSIGLDEAKVICHELGFGYLISLDNFTPPFGIGLSDALHRRFECGSEAEALSECYSKYVDIQRYNCEGVSITCSASKLTPGGLVGIAVGGLSVAIFVAFFLCCIFRCNKRSQRPYIQQSLPVTTDVSMSRLSRDVTSQLEVTRRNVDMDHDRPPQYQSVFPEGGESMDAPPPSYEAVAHGELV